MEVQPCGDQAARQVRVPASTPITVRGPWPYPIRSVPPSGTRLQSPHNSIVAQTTESLASQLVTALAKLGIDTYFGVPGGAIEPLFDALAEQGRRGKIRFVGTRSESAAAFAADGFYRQSGRMAVCTATTGPGTSNLITGVMAAKADRIPMLVLTPQVALHKQGRGALQDSSPDAIDLVNMLAQCTRYSCAVTHPEQLPHKLSRALTTALAAPPGPVHLSLPTDLLRGRPCEKWEGYAWRTIPRSTPFDPVALDYLSHRLSSARTPTFYVGDDAGPAAARLCQLAAHRGVPVVASPAGKRWIAHDHPAYVGVLGFSGHQRAMTTVEESDLIVAFGATFDELSTNAWTTMDRVPILSVDSHLEHACRLPNIEPVLASPERAIDAIAEVPLRRWTHSTSKKTASKTAPLLTTAPTPGAVHPGAFMEWLGGVLPHDVVVHVDAGNGFSWSTRHLARKTPDTYRVAMGLSSMGWAVSAVIGAVIGQRRRTVCVCGDGSMLMSSLELTVAVAERLPVTYFVLNNGELGMVKHGQRLSGAEPIGTQLPRTAFDLLAQACGARGIRVETWADLERLPREVLADDDAGPCIVDVRIDQEEVPPIKDRVRGLTGQR